MKIVARARRRGLGDHRRGPARLRGAPAAAQAARREVARSSLLYGLRLRVCERPRTVQPAARGTAAHSAGAPAGARGRCREADGVVPRRAEPAPDGGLRRDGPRRCHHEAQREPLPARLSQPRLDQGPHPPYRRVCGDRIPRRDPEPPQQPHLGAVRPTRQDRVCGACRDGPVPGGTWHAACAAPRAETEDMPLRSHPLLRDHFPELRTDLPPQWVKPVVVVQVEYRKRTGRGLRHAALKGLRPDQLPRRVVQSTLS